MYNAYRIGPLNRVGESAFTPFLSFITGKFKDFKTISDRLENYIKNFQPSYIPTTCSNLFGHVLECAVHNAYRIKPINRVDGSVHIVFLPSLTGAFKAFRTIPKHLENLVRNFESF